MVRDFAGRLPLLERIPLRPEIRFGHRLDQPSAESGADGTDSLRRCFGGARRLQNPAVRPPSVNLPARILRLSSITTAAFPVL